MESMPPNWETARLDALCRYQILDTEPETAFDDFATLAAQICQTPIALLSLIDRDRQWFKAKVGTTLAQTPREIAFCAHAIEQNDVFVVPDTLMDERFATNPLVTGKPHLRFYAGAPLINPQGYALGTLCVLDRVPRTLNTAQIEALQALSRQAIAQLERRRNLADLEQLRQEYDRFFNLSPDLMCIAGLDGYFKRISPVFVEKLGFSAEELLASPFIEFVHPDDKAATLRELASLAKNEVTIQFENRYRCRDGSYRWLAWNAFPRVEEGRVYAIARDITLLKDAEQERLHLLQRERVARTEAEAARQQSINILESITDAFFALDRDWRFTYLNLQAESLLRRHRGELLGKLIWEEFPEAVGSPFYEEYNRAVSEQVSVEFEAFYPPLDSWFSVHAYPSEEGLSVYFENIDERKQAEAALRHSEERYRLLFENNPHPMWVFDWETLKFLAVNEAAIAHYGYSRQEFLAMSILDIRPPEDIPALLDRRKLTTTGLDKAGVWRHCKQDGTLIEVEITGHSLTIDGKQAAVILADDVTERRRAQAALMETMVLQRAILDSANYTIISTTADGTILTFNAAAQRLLGYDAQEVVGKTTPMLIHDRAEVEQRARELTAELGKPVAPGFECFVAKARLGEPDEREWTYIRKDGTRFPVLLSITTLRDEGGQIAGFLGIGSDITERRQVEAELRAYERQQAAVAQFGQRALAGVNPHTLMDEAATLIARGLEVEYCQVWEFLPSEEVLQLRAGVGSQEKWAGQVRITLALERPEGFALRGDEPVVIEDLRQDTRFLEASRLRQQGIVSGLCLSIPGSPAPLGVLGAYSSQARAFREEDIHFLQAIANILTTAIERQWAQAELQRQILRSQLFAEIALKIRQSLHLEEILQTAVNEVQHFLQADRVVIFRLFADGSGRIVQEAVVPGWAAIWGRDIVDPCFGEEYIEKYRQGRVSAITNIKHSELQECYVELLQEFQVKANLVVPILQQEQLWGLLIAHQCSGSRQWTSFETELLLQLANQIGIALAQARLLKQEIHQRQELARSNAELQEFAYVASHDLQEPLRKIQAFSDRLQSKCRDALTEQGRDYLERMQGAARRMQGLIEDLLTLSRVTTQAQPFVPTDLNQVVREVLSDLEVRLRQTGGGVEVGELPTLDADPGQMRRLCQNLLSNALKFHQDGEPPAIRIYSSRLQSVATGMGFSDRWQIFIEDNGIGFDEKYLDRIFNPFQRLHGRGEFEGTGMGLAICRKIVERHGGTLEARSTPGEGTTFIATLPANQPQGDHAE